MGGFKKSLCMPKERQSLRIKPQEDLQFTLQADSCHVANNLNQRNKIKPKLNKTQNLKNPSKLWGRGRIRFP